MADEFKQWEYRVQTIGSVFGTKAENTQATLDEWGMEGWELINVYTAKRPLTERARRQRSMPQMG